MLELLLNHSSSFKDETKKESDYDNIENSMSLAAQLAKQDKAKKEEEFEAVTKQRKKFFGPKWGLRSFKKSRHPLSVIVCTWLVLGLIIMTDFS